LGRRLRMTAELRDWLAELGESQPLTAAEVGAALVAVLESADPSDLAVVGQPPPPSVTYDPREVADYAYQHLLEQFSLLRRRVADAATRRHDLEVQISAQRAAGADAAVIDGLAEQLAAAQLGEATLARASQRVQREIDAFLTAKETAKARYTAAEASLRIAEAIEAAGGEPDPDPAYRRDDVRAAKERLRALHASATETLERIRQLSDPGDPRHPPSPGQPKPSPPSPARTADGPKPPPPLHPLRPQAESAPGLLALRADPLGSDIRILFAAEPADTVTLLAVLEGPEAAREHGAHAVRLAGDLLTEIRDDGWPTDIDEVVLADRGEFLAQFFPADDADGIVRRADVLAAMTPLARLRADRQLTIEEVAARSGLSALRVAAIERDGLRAARVHEAVALARALRARLELPGDSGPVAG
jgi:phage shock protein A